MIVKKSTPLSRARKFREEIFFNKKRREKIKKALLKTQKTILEKRNFSEKPRLKKEYEERALLTTLLEFSVRGLETVKDAEKLDKELSYANCKAYLFKKGRSIVLKGTFFKPLLDNNIRTSFMYFPQGFPNYSKRKTFIYKHGKTLDLTGYKEIDLGTFQQKIVNFNDFSLIFKGKKDAYKFKLKLINNEGQSYWATKIL